MKLQSLQLEMARTTIGHYSHYWSTTRLLKHMGWMNVVHILGYVSNKLTYIILYNKQPQLLHHRMTKDRTSNPTQTRLSGPYKMGSRPKNVGRTKLTRFQYRAQTYHYYSQIPEKIQNFSNYRHLTKWIKKYYKYGSVTPNEKLPTFQNTNTKDNP